MKLGLKRVIAMICSVVMVAGVFFTGNSWTAKADDTTNAGTTVTKEWQIVNEDTPATKDVVKTDLNVNCQSVDRSNLVLYMQVDLTTDAAVTAMSSNVSVELGQTNTADQKELQWIMKRGINSSIVSVQKGLNVILLQFSETSNFLVDQDTTTTDSFVRFRLYGANTEEVILKEVKVVDISPIVQRYEIGTGGTAPTENIPEGYKFAGWYTEATCENALGKEVTKEGAYAKFVNEDVLGVKAQYEVTDILPGLMIVDCDSIPSYVSDVVSDYSITKVEGEYQEGTGAFKYANGTANDRIRMKFDDEHKIDISGYEKLHLWFYVNDVDNLGSALWIGIGSGGAKDTNEHKWMVAKTDLKDEWNEIVLDLSAADNTDCGPLDLSAVNYFRIWTNTAGNENLVTIVDDIRAIDPGLSIADCDSFLSYATYGMSSHVITTENAEHKEGTGACKFANGTFTLRFGMAFDDEHKIDISGYDKVHLWFYVNDVDNLGSALWIGIGSDGKGDSSEHKWMRAKDKLQDGWNEIVLDLSTKDANIGELNLSAVNYFRIWTNTAGNANLVTIVDDIRAIKDGTVLTTTQKADLRFVTTVDSLKYRNVGFKITIGGKTLSKESTEVYNNLFAVGSQEELLTIFPYQFAPQSKHFNTHTITNIPSAGFDTEILVVPYWTTQDGTVVEGTQSTYTINGLIAANSSSTESNE